MAVSDCCSPMLFIYRVFTDLADLRLADRVKYPNKLALLEELLLLLSEFSESILANLAEEVLY